MTAVNVTDYLDRLRLASAEEPSVPALGRLFAAHIELVPFETLDRPVGIDPHYSLERIVYERRGGVCYHLNGAFSLLLQALGYDVTMHPAGVQSIFNATPPGAIGTHNLLVVSGLPDPANPGGRWIVDVGSGEGYHLPLPLASGTYRQGEFTYRVRPSDTAPDCWRVDYDERESCLGIDFAEQVAEPDDFTDLYHRQVENDIEILFRYGWAKRHHADGFDELVGCLQSSVRAAGRSKRKITTAEEYYATLADLYGLTLLALDEDQRSARWERVYETWRTQNLFRQLPAVPEGQERRGVGGRSRGSERREEATDGAR
jgi:N-hydroxyarylamine O-acetyltransferase